MVKILRRLMFARNAFPTSVSAPLVVALGGMLMSSGAVAAGPADGGAAIQWDRSTLQLVMPGGGYGRMIRLTDGGILLCGQKMKKSWTRLSRDNGKTWNEPVLAAEYSAGIAANPELMQRSDGGLLLFFNGRPEDKRSPYLIGMAASADGGATWKARTEPVFTAGITNERGCWEPAALELPSGEIQLFFANEYPYEQTNEQEISLMRSLDGGQTWSAPERVSFRARRRDGMPVPILLRRGGEPAGVAVAIEDGGLTPGRKLQPAIVWTPLADNWRQGPALAVLGSAEENARQPGADRRWGALAQMLPPTVYAGAPYLRQLFDGRTILSYQCDQGRQEPEMIVCLGDDQARNFAHPSAPFALPPDVPGKWNALFVKDALTVTAITGAKIDGQSGLWLIDGRVAPVAP